MAVLCINTLSHLIAWLHPELSRPVQLIEPVILRPGDPPNQSSDQAKFPFRCQLPMKKADLTLPEYASFCLRRRRHRWRAKESQTPDWTICPQYHCRAIGTLMSQLHAA